MYEVALLHAAAMHVEYLKLESPSNRTCESPVRFVLVSNRLRSIKHLCQIIHVILSGIDNVPEASDIVR